MVKQKGALPPKRLSPYMQNLYRGLFVLGIVGVIVGSCGLIVLLGMLCPFWDSDRSSSRSEIDISQSRAFILVKSRSRKSCLAGLCT